MPRATRPTHSASTPPDLRPPASDIVGACRRLHAAIDRLDERVATAADISRSDLRCLNLLEFGPLPATAIARQLNLATGSVTALIDRLEAKGLVARLRSGNDRRVVQVQATAKVFQVIGPIYIGFADRLRQQVKVYTAAERKLAIKHLLDVAEVCDVAAAENT
jgi:DNA-binding Lrp family transcriptional regulator